MPFRTRLRNRLAAASLALGACGTLPVDALAEWVEAELEREPEPRSLESVDIAGRMAAGARAAVANLWTQSRESSETFVKQLSSNDSASLRVAAAAALGRILELASPMERVELVCRWTIADEPRERLTVARALGLPTQVFVADLAIGELARDASPAVRAAAARAARVHARTDPQGFGRILAGLSNDAVPTVRNAARGHPPSSIS